VWVQRTFKLSPKKKPQSMSKEVIPWGTMEEGPHAVTVAADSLTWVLKTGKKKLGIRPRNQINYFEDRQKSPWKIMSHPNEGLKRKEWLSSRERQNPRVPREKNFKCPRIPPGVRGARRGNSLGGFKGATVKKFKIECRRSRGEDELWFPREMKGIFNLRIDT